MPDFLADTARTRPDALALDDGSRSWSYRELDQRTSAAANRLRALGAAGQAVALVSETTGPAVVAAHAALRAGAVLAPLNPRLTAEELRPALEVLTPRLVLAAPEAWDRVMGAGVRPAPLDALEADAGGVVLADRILPRHGCPAVPEGTCVVIWTSGTGGRPRGVALTHANLSASIRGAGARLALGPGDRWLATLGLALIGGLVLTLRAAATGAELVARGRFLPDEAASLMASGAVSHASLVPTMLRQLVDMIGERPVPALRCLLVGGAACPRALVESAVRAGLPL